MTENADTRYGRLLEGAHLAGYTFARAQTELIALLESGEWKKVGTFDDVNDFLRSIDLSAWKIEDRPKLVKAIKYAQPKASNRAIAAVVGADRRTVDRDVGANAPPADAAERSKGSGGGANAPLSGEKVHNLATRRKARQGREAALKEKRTELEEQARASGLRASIEQADVRTWRPTGVSVIVTDPPYITADAVDLYSSLADFALDVLPDGGALATLCWQPILGDVFAAMQRQGLVFRWCSAWIFDLNGARTFDQSRRVMDGWKPVLIFHKGMWSAEAPAIRDTIVSPGRVPGDEGGELHRWEQSTEGMSTLIEHVSWPGDTVCDPFAGSGTTGVAANACGRHFIGCDVDAETVETARQRLAIKV